MKWQVSYGRGKGGIWPGEEEEVMSRTLKWVQRGESMSVLVNSRILAETDDNKGNSTVTILKTQCFLDDAQKSLSWWHSAPAMIHQPVIYFPQLTTHTLDFHQVNLFSLPVLSYPLLSAMTFLPSPTALLPQSALVSKAECGTISDPSQIRRFSVMTPCPQCQTRYLAFICLPAVWCFKGYLPRAGCELALLRFGDAVRHVFVPVDLKVCRRINHVTSQILM